ncbi:hypothetical protein A2361_00255 [Candidatus Woesebacteria bacterium RIFOXYB1_FULL_40_26]|uniref:Four helix bundle protein n=2 Tax=Candidatus Woeseibacteriota TaxID=1752722 RepID=A0A1F8D094_9BACT|nr:MAG: Intervening sequence [Candidatus Woesebacteria bacterium GW2011_GWB1_40_101]OGM81786.1 MAG: hypothetical protein A2361_00255 [Candidatus Woesebacteria bacterium RIFOXYB1_FULL_40_26]
MVKTYKRVITFTDFEVYQRLYKLTLGIHKEILPKLPKAEQYSLKDQLSRSSKSPCALIAEAYARRTSSKEWRKYIREAIGECNESIVHVSLIRDLYSDKVDTNLCNRYIEEYNIAGKQLFRLGESWK